MTTRRNAVSRAVLALAGLAGLSVGSAAAIKLAPTSEPSAVVLHGRNWRTSRGRPGELPTEGERISVRGELIDDKEGVRVGEFFAAGFAIGGGLHPAHGERLELHTFKLRDGTIIGAAPRDSSRACSRSSAAPAATPARVARTSRASVIRTSAETGPLSSC